MSSVSSTPFFAGAVLGNSDTFAGDGVVAYDGTMLGEDTTANAAGPLAQLFSPAVESTSEPLATSPADALPVPTTPPRSASPAEKPPGLTHSPDRVPPTSAPTSTTVASVDQWSLSCQAGPQHFHRGFLSR